MRVGRLVLIILGSLIGLTGLGVLASGGVLLWAHETQRDANGYFRTTTERLATPTYGFTSREVDLGSDPGGHVLFVGNDLATVRLRAARTDSGPVFVGIARSSDVEQYLTNVAHAEIESASFHSANFRDADVTTVPVPGTARPASPSEQSFWVASASGRGTRTVEWKVAGGAYSAVVMNADGSRPVAVDASVGVKLNWLLALAIGLLLGGFVVLAIGVTLIVVGAVALRHEPVAPGGGVGAGGVAGPAPRVGVAAASYPLRVDGRLDPQLSRWLWLVKGILAVPHYLILLFLWLAFGALTVIAFFAILFTGRYPRGIFEFNVGVLRWSWRVAFYSFGALGTDRYPPFSLEDDPSYPARLAVDYPERLSRGLVLVKWWLLAFPQYLIVAVFTGGWWGPGRSWHGYTGPPSGGGLIQILVVIAGVALLFTAAYPPGLFRFVMGLDRWALRVAAYVALLRDEYPPFRLDPGGDDPGTPAPAVTEAWEAPPQDMPPEDVPSGS